MQNSLSAMTNLLARAISRFTGENFSKTFIVWGILSGSDRDTVIAGAVCIDGKLYEVPHLGARGDNKYLCFRQTLSDERIFEDGQKRKVKGSYEAYLSTATDGAVASMDLDTAILPVGTREGLNIEIYDEAKAAGWSGSAERVRMPMGWLYFVKLSYKKKDNVTYTDPRIGQFLFGGGLNNRVSLCAPVNFDGSSPRYSYTTNVTICYGAETNKVQELKLSVPRGGEGSERKTCDNPSVLGNKCYVHFTFFDYDFEFFYNM